MGATADTAPVANASCPPRGSGSTTRNGAGRGLAWRLASLVPGALCARSTDAGPRVKSTTASNTVAPPRRASDGSGAMSGSGDRDGARSGRPRAAPRVAFPAPSSEPESQPTSCPKSSSRSSSTSRSPYEFSNPAFASMPASSRSERAPVPLGGAPAATRRARWAPRGPSPPFHRRASRISWPIMTCVFILILRGAPPSEPCSTYSWYVGANWCTVSLTTSSTAMACAAPRRTPSAPTPPSET
mmetsp:Transcript_8442/g.35780  ORF Transcript_8442/g.35780 Transcript_8442/m.35780 type:complete len:243 (-) Transcript_8442:1017-1745(-)